MNGDPQKIISVLRAQGRSDQYIVNTLVNSPNYNMDPSEARSLVGSQVGGDDVVQPRPTYKIASVDPRQALELPEPEGEPESQEMDSGIWQYVEDATRDIPGLGWFTDFIGDQSRAFVGGYYEGSAGGEAFAAGMGFGDLDDYQKVADTIRRTQGRGLSDEALNLENELRRIEEEGGGYWDRMLARGENLDATAELIFHSLGLMAGGGTEATTLAVAGSTGLATGATFAAIGGGTGAAVTAPTGPGAAVGGAAGAGIGFAGGFSRGFVGGLSGMIDAEATIMQIVKEELGDKEPTAENVAQIFENEEVRKRMQWEAGSRGVAIGVADAITMGLASKSSAGLVGRSLFTRGAVTTGVETTGASFGELAAQLVSTGDVDWDEVTLEGLMEAPMGGISLAAGTTATYEVNGERVKPQDVLEFVESGHMVDEKQIKVKRDKDLQEHIRRIRKEQAPTVDLLKQDLQTRAQSQGKQLFGIGIDRAANHAFKKYNEAMADGNVTAAQAAIDAAIDHVSARYSGTGVFELDIDQQSSGQRARALGRSRYDSQSNAAYEMLDRAKRIRSFAKEVFNKEEKASMLANAKQLEAEAESTLKERVNFYRDLVVSDPDLAKRIQSLDISIVNTERMLMDENLPEDLREDMKKGLADAVATRVGIERSLAEKNVQLNEKQKAESSYNDVEEKVSAIDARIEEVESKIDDLHDSALRGEPDMEELRSAMSELDALKEEKNDIGGIIEDYNQAKAEYEAALEDLGGEDQTAFRAAEEKMKEARQALDMSIGKLDVTEETSNSEVSSVSVNDFIEAPADAYVSAMELARKADEEKGSNLFLQVSPVSLEEAQRILNDGGSLFLSKDGMAGGYVTSDGYIGGLFKSPNSPMKGAAGAMLELSKEKGGKYMDAYATKLEEIYVDAGFKPVARVDFNPEFAPEGWDADNSPLKGKPDVVFFTLGEGKIGDGKRVESYDEAMNMAQEEASKVEKEPKSTESEFADIDEAVKDARPEVKETTENRSVDTGKVPEKAVSTPRAKDGNPAWRSDVAGITSSEAKTLNSLQKMLDNLGVKMYVYPDSETAMEFDSGNWGGLYDPTTNTIHINPSQIRDNAAIESEVLNRTKTFSETVMEEVLHAALPMAHIYSVNPKKAASIRSEIRKALSNDPDLLARIDAKVESYRSEGVSEAVLFEEEVHEFLSALAADPSSVNLKTVDKIRVAINKMIAAAYGAIGKEFSIKDTDSLIAIAGKFAAAKNGKASVSSRTQGTRAQSNSRASKMVSPTRIPVNKDGKVVVRMEETFYKYDIGFKKDIGSETITKTFNDVWHFVNWWKKATNMGADQHYFGFETEDGTTIDVDRIKDYKSKRRSTQINTPMGIAKDINAMSSAAVSQGILGKAVLSTIRRKVRGMSTKIQVMEGRNQTDSPRYKNEVEKLKAFSKYVSSIIDREAKDLGKEFRYGSNPDVRASQLISKDAIENGTSPIDLEFIREEIGKATGFKPNNRVVAYQVMFKHLMERFPDKESRRAHFKSLMGKYIADEKLMAETFGGRNPLDFFSDWETESRPKVQSMIDSGVITGSLQDNVAKLNIFAALTSAKNSAVPNIKAAFWMLQESEKYKVDNPLGVTESFIKMATKASEGAPGLEGMTKRQIRVSLRKLMDLVNGNMDGYENMSPIVKDGIKRATGARDNFYGNQDVRWKDLMKFLMTPFDGPNVKFRGRVMSQVVFGNKIGAWAMNLNSANYKDMVNNEGQRMSDIVTIDTHVLNTTALINGLWYDAPVVALYGIRKLRELREYLSDSDTFGASKVFKDFTDLEASVLEKAEHALRRYPEERTERDNLIIKNASEIIRDEIDWAVKTADQLELEGDTDTARSIDRAIDKVLNPHVSESPIVKRASVDLVNEVTQYINETFEKNYSPAQVGQLIFADRQVFDFGMFDRSGESKPPRPYVTYSDAIPQVENERRASTMLMFPSENNQNAADSPLYRSRKAEEATMMRDGRRITNKLTDEALSTDATSRRIMEKNSEVKQGQKVGIRLNLNVMKNTGVPVQTMHDKTASGEALRYSPAVMVKNPELFVNQNARRKIVTFQENKFPMASVNGEFLTDQLDQMNFDGVKAFFNPFKHNVFVDASGRPIKSAEEATVIGNTVYLRGDIEYFDYNDPILKRGRKETPKELEDRIKRSPKYDKALKRFKAFSERNGVEFDSEADLELAYDNMPIESKVAMSESEVAANMEEAQRMASGLLKLRKTAGRGARQYGGDIRRQILDNPNNYFTPQSIKEAKGMLKDKSDQDLVAIMSQEGLSRLQDRNDDLGVLAAGELISRAVSRGDLDAIPSIIAEAAAIGTTAGRILRHFRELKSASPKGIEQIIKGEVERRGNTLSESQTARLQDMAGNLFRLQAEHEDLVRRAIAGEEVDAALKAKTDEVKAAERELDTFANGVIERGWGQIGTMLIQGNLLTPMSQVTNVGANMINALGKVAVDAIALPVERMINMFGIESPMKRTYSINAYMYGIRKFGAGFVEALDGIITGQEKDVSEWRVHRGFAPFRSLMAAVGKGDLPMGPDGKAPLSQRMKLAVQGTLGIPAEVMFRFLSLGDVPFRRYVEGIELYQAGRAQGLEGEALAQFIKHPTKKERAAAEMEGRKLTYQEQTGASQAAEDAVAFFERMFTKAFDWIPGADGQAMAKFLIRSNLPYVRTPANILLDTLTYVSPYVAGPRIMNNLKNKDAREAAQNFGKLVVGSMVSQTAVLLLKEGLISGAIEWNEDEEKNIAYDQFPPNSINVSGLRRFMAGESTEKQPDDYFISYNKLGVAGAIIGAIVKGADKEELRNRDYSGINFPIHALQDSFGVGAFSSISYMMDQSFLQGMNTLVDVISSSEAGEFEKNFENWFRTTFQAVSATAFPNTLSAMYRGTREYLPDTRVTKDMSLSERLMTRMAYTIKDRTFGLGDVPVRVNWKGEPIKQTPRGNNGIAYQLFDITKSRQGEADPVSNEIWRLYEETEDLTKVVGTPGYAEKRKLNIPNVRGKNRKLVKALGKSYTWIDDEEFMAERIYLNTEQMNMLMAASGKERYAEVEAFMATEEYKAMDSEERIEALNEIADNYNSAIERSGGSFRNHTLVLFDILQKIYDEREEI
jgi:hypothetical protein